MGLLNQYLFGRAVKTVGGLIIFAMVVLLLERLLRIFQVVATSSKPGSDATNMVVNLLPHYLGIAIPMALLLGIIITMDRLSKSSELVAGLGAGVSLMHITRPFLFIAAVLAIFTVFIEGYLQPVGRYNYRQVEHSIKQTSYAAALREGTFTEVGNRTFFAGTDLKGSDIGPIFIHEVIYDKGEVSGVRLITAERGKLEIREEIKEPVLQLSEGQTYQVMDEEKLLGGLSFEKSAISGANRTESFRVRGDDEREMTSLELFENRKGDRNTNISVNENNATLNLRLAKAALLLLLPFIAVPFGLNYGAIRPRPGYLSGL